MVAGSPRKHFSSSLNIALHPAANQVVLSCQKWRLSKLLQLFSTLSKAGPCDGMYLLDEIKCPSF